MSSLNTFVNLSKVSSFALVILLSGNAFTWAMEEDSRQELPVFIGKKALSKKDVDSLLDRYLHVPQGEDQQIDMDESTAEQFLTRLDIRKKIQVAYSELDISDLRNVGTFLKLCLQAYLILEGSVPLEDGLKFFGNTAEFDNYTDSKVTMGHSYQGAWADYYENLPCFKKYFGIRDGEEIKDKEIYYLGFFSALDFSLEHEDYKRAHSFLFKLDSVSEENIRSVLQTYVINHFLDPQTGDPKKSPAHFKKLCKLYQAPFKAQGLKEEEYDVTDYITLVLLHRFGNEFEEAIQCGMRALAMPWPSKDDGEYIIRFSQQDMRFLIGFMFYQLKKYREAKDIYLQDVNNLNANSCIQMALIYAQEENIEEAFNFLVAATEKSKRNEPIYIDYNDLLPLTELLMKIKKKNIKPFRDKVIELLKKAAIPSIRADIERLIREKDKERHRNLIKTKIAGKKVAEAREHYLKFDGEYTKIWAQASHLLEIKDKNFLKRVDELARLMEETFQKIKDIYSSNLLKNFQDILMLKNKIEALYDEFIIEIFQASLNIGKVRRSLVKTEKKETLQIPSVNGVYSNLKKEYRNREIAEGEKEVKKSWRAKKGEKSSVANLYDKEKDVDPEKRENHLRTFANSETKDIWNSRDVGSYPAKALELLDSLSQARSMFHLRQLTPPGTKLEMLEGDNGLIVSLHINDQYRLCFRWVIGDGAYDIKITKHYK
jgi:toxin HigB-1